MINAMLIRCSALCLSLVIAAGCATNPSTGRSQFILPQIAAQTTEMGAAAKPELIQEYGGEVQSAQLRQYVQRVGERLARHVEPEYSDVQWDFTLLDSDVINAFALPGGHVFMSRGLMEGFTNEAQLAGVLGHEIGHVTALHVDERLSQAMLVQGVAEAASSVAGQSESALVSQAVPVLVGLGGQGYLLKFGRDQEAEADIQGLKYMAAAGYDPAAMLEVLAILSEADQGGRPPEFLSTHPYPETRLETVRRLLRTEYSHTQNSDAYRKFQERFEREARPYLRSGG